MWLLEASADLHDVRDFLGHANITATSRYLRSAPVRLAQALERMEASAAERVVSALAVIAFGKTTDARSTTANERGA